jgi:hypothetical protein
MSYSLSVKDSGTWRTATEVHARSGGSWRKCQQVFVRDGGSWRLVFGVQAGNTSYTVDDVETGTTASASITFDTTGDVSFTGNGSDPSGVWFSPSTAGIGSSYWIKFTNASGFSLWDNTGTIANNTVYALSTARTLTWTQSSLGAKLILTQVRIYSDSGGTVEQAYLEIVGSVEWV